MNAVGEAIEFRWRWNHDKWWKWRHLLYGVLGTLCATVIAIAAFMQSAHVTVRLGFLAIVLMGLFSTMAILAELVNSTTLRLNGAALTVHHGPVRGFTFRRPPRVEASRVARISVTRGGSPSRYDYSLVCRTTDGDRLRLDSSLRESAGAGFVRHRLNKALGLDL